MDSARAQTHCNEYPIAKATRVLSEANGQICQSPQEETYVWNNFIGHTQEEGCAMEIPRRFRRTGLLWYHVGCWIDCLFSDTDTRI
jgi:hypothetical protein